MSATVTAIHADRQQESGIGYAELIARTGLTYRQIDYHCRAGRLHPIGEDRPGTGQVRRFSEPETHVAVLLKQLMDVGFTVTAAAALAREHVEGGRVVRVVGDSVLIGASKTVMKAPAL